MDKISLLIVDDEIVVQGSCVDIFTEKSNRYDITTVSSGDEAEALLTRKHFDIILTDLKMPGLPGMELIARIRTKHPDTAIIVITGFSTVQTAVEVMKQGAIDFIPKPFTPDEIFNVVENAASKLKSHGSK